MTTKAVNQSMSALKHEPLRPARASHDGEKVYSSMWAAMMAEEWHEDWFNGDEPTPLEIMLHNFGRTPTQRHATVAATMICWLGCNMGSALMHRAKAETAAGRWDRSFAYLLAWTMENRRVDCVNGGIRSVEYMLTPAEDLRTGLRFAESAIAKLPELSAEDLEVIDHIMLWLPGERGQRFIRQCEKEIDRLRDEERRRQQAEFRRLHGVDHA